MPEIKKILFPVDLSKNSDKVVPYVITMARALDAEVCLLFVARAFNYYDNIYVPQGTIHNFESEIARGAQKRLDEFSREFMGEACRYDTKIRTGDPAQEIVEYIESKSFDLVIMGSHGRKGLNQLLFGSVADHVVKHSPVPVMIVNPHRSPKT